MGYIQLLPESKVKPSVKVTGSSTCKRSTLKAARNKSLCIKFLKCIMTSYLVAFKNINSKLHNFWCSENRAEL